MNIPAIFYSAAVWVIPLIIAIVFHEVAHGWVANAFGDPTARRMNRLSFNPIRHVDPVGTVLLPLVLAIAHAPVFGWAKPVPVVASRMRNPRWNMMLVALAGPAMNLALATAAALALALFVALWHGGIPTGVAGFALDNLINFVIINVSLAVFNLLPVPPFDGGHVVEGLLPRSLSPYYSQLRRYSFPLLLFLLVVLPMIAPNLNLLGRIIGPPINLLLRFFLGIAGLSV